MANENEQIMIADAIFDGHSDTTIISSDEIIEAAWYLIDNYNIPQDAFDYMIGRTR